MARLTIMSLASRVNLDSDANSASPYAERVLFYAFLLLLFWLPLPLGSNRPWAWSIMELASFTLVIALLWVCRPSLEKRLRPHLFPITLFCLFVLWVGVQYLPLPAALVKLLSPDSYRLFASSGSGVAPWLTLSVDPVQTKISFYKSLSYLCLFISCLLVVTSPSRARAVLVCFLVAGTWQALYGSVEALSGSSRSLVFELPVKSIATGSFVYRNHYANYLLLCLAMSIGLLVSSLETRQLPSAKAWLRSTITTLLSNKALVRISLAIMVIGLVMSRSRMGNAAFFVAMTVTGLLGLCLIKNRTRGLTYLIVSMVVIDTFILSAWFGLSKIQDRLLQTSLQHESRDEVIRDAVPMLGDFGGSGAGMGSFYGLFPGYKGESVRLFYDHVHNDYLQFMIEAGIPATLLLMVLVSFCAYSALQAMYLRHNSTMKGVAFGSVMAITGMAIHMTVDFPLQASANAAYYVVILAMAQVSLHTKTGMRRRRGKTARQ